MENKEQIQEVEKIINSIVGRFPPHLRKDLKQECWIIAIEKIPKFKPGNGTLFSFLFARLRGHCFNWMGKEITPYVELDPHYFKI